jgi:hypothetical protein
MISHSDLVNIIKLCDVDNDGKLNLFDFINMIDYFFFFIFYFYFYCYLLIYFLLF